MTHSQNPKQKMSYEALLEKYTQSLQEIEELKEHIRHSDRRIQVTAHELRSPLNGIIGIAELLKDDGYEGIPFETKEYIKMMTSCAEVLERILNTELTTQIPVPEKTQFYLIDEIKKLGHSKQPFVAAHGNLNYNIYTDDSDYLVSGFRSYLDEVVNNLVDNAVKYTESGNISLVANASPLNEESVLLELVVSDTGYGIPDESKERIIKGEKEQPNSPINTSYPSSGIGLPRIADLISRQNGSMVIEDNKPKGTSFYISLPYERVK